MLAIITHSEFLNNFAITLHKTFMTVLHPSPYHPAHFASILSFLFKSLYKSPQAPSSYNWRFLMNCLSYKLERLRTCRTWHQIQFFCIACVSGMIVIDKKDILFTFLFLQSPEIGYKPNFLDNIWRWHLANNVAFCPPWERDWRILKNGGMDLPHPLVAYRVIV